MSLEGLVEKYDNDFGFKLKCKLKHYAKKAKSLLAIGALAYMGVSSTIGVKDLIQCKENKNPKPINGRVPWEIPLTTAGVGIAGYLYLRKKNNKPKNKKLDNIEQFLKNPFCEENQQIDCKINYEDTIEIINNNHKNIFNYSKISSTVLGSATTLFYFSQISDLSNTFIINGKIGLMASIFYSSAYVSERVLEYFKKIKLSKNDIQMKIGIITSGMLFESLKLRKQNKLYESNEFQEELDELNHLNDIINAINERKPKNLYELPKILSKKVEDNIYFGEYIEILSNSDMKLQNQELIQAMIFDSLITRFNYETHKMDLEGIMNFKKEYCFFEKESDNLWENVLSKVLRENKTEPIYGEHVLTLKENLVSDLFIIKKLDEEEAIYEKLLAERVEKLIAGHKEYDMSKPYKILKYNDDYYYFNKKIDGNDLNSIFSIEPIIKASKYLRLIHDNINSSKNRRDYKKELEDRLPQIPEWWDEIWKEIDEDYVVDMDPHGGQWIFDGEKIYRIDFSDKGSVQRGFQLNKLVVESEGSVWLDKRDVVLKNYDYENHKQYDLCMLISAHSYISKSFYKGLDINEVKRRYAEAANISAQNLGFKNIGKYFKKIEEEIINSMLAENFI
ncbi:hypothetical protein KY334_07530 [Candidatus Woesearchaeota archaeon]|nr:hypothetical protein [Candidatus Woesearchaeota archaeon]